MSKLKKRVTLRTSVFTPEVLSYLDHQIQKGKNQTEAINDLLQKGIQAHEEEEKAYANLHQRRGASLETNQYVRRKDPILIPCSNTNRWVDKKLDCEIGCKLKCNLTTDQRVLIEGLMLYTKY